MSQPDRFFTDLPRHVGGGFRPARGQGEGWVAFDYKTDGLEGNGLATGDSSGAPALALDLGLTGLHQIAVGVGNYANLRFWIEGDKGFRDITTQHGGVSIQECALHTADMTGRRLMVAPTGGVSRKGGSLAYVRATPVAALPASARNLVGTNDGFTWIYFKGIDSLRDVHSMFTPLRDSDYFRILWGPLGADFSGGHRSRVGTTAPFDPTHARRQGDRVFAETLRRVLQSEGDILPVAVEAAADVGVEIQFYVRVEAFQCPFPHDDTWTSQFFLDHPQWWCRDEQGRPVHRMSYAYREVQDHMLAYFAELLDFNPAGLSLAFNRSLPMMICEAPVIDEFRRRHGREPRLPEEVDSPELVKVRQDILADFVGRARLLVDSRGKSLSAIVDGNESDFELMGMDLAALVRNGLFEAVHVTGPCAESAYWLGLLKQGHTNIYPAVGGPAKTWDHREYAAQALKTIHAPGFAGAFCWDVETVFENPYNWQTARRAGSRDYLAATADGRIAPPLLRPLTEIRGVRVDRYFPWKSY